jgi:hypothetical protein
MGGAPRGQSLFHSFGWLWLWLVDVGLASLFGCSAAPPWSCVASALWALAAEGAASTNSLTVLCDHSDTQWSQRHCRRRPARAQLRLSGRVGSTGSTKPQPKSNTQNTAGSTYDTTCSNERAAYDMRHIRNTACNDSGAMWSPQCRTREMQQHTLDRKS